MKIAIVGNHFTPCIGGVEKVMEDTAGELARRGHEVKVVCLDTCAKSERKLPEKEKISGIEVERIGCLDLRYYKIAPAVLGKIRGCDIVHVHGIGFFSDFLIATKSLHRKPVVVSTHGGIFHTHDIWILKAMYFSIAQRLLLPLADRVVAVSRNDKEEFGMVCGNVALVENGIRPEDFSPGKKKPNTFLFVGRFSRNKRVERLLEAFSLLMDMDLTLTIAGTDWEGLLQGYLRKNALLSADNRVRYVADPSRERLRELYAEAEFFVSASSHEGFGIALVEAMASGCIPIVQDNEGFSSILGDSGAGVLLDFSDARQAARAIRSLMDWGTMRKRHLQRLAVRRAKSFSWEGRVDEIERIYFSVLGDKKKHFIGLKGGKE